MPTRGLRLCECRTCKMHAQREEGEKQPAYFRIAVVRNWMNCRVLFRVAISASPRAHARNAQSSLAPSQGRVMARLRARGNDVPRPTKCCSCSV